MRNASCDPRRHRALFGLASAAFVCAAWLALALVPGVAGEARAVGKGVVDSRLEAAFVDADTSLSVVDQMGAGGLGAGWSRIWVRWALLQPAPPDADGDPEPEYDQRYVAQLETVLQQLHAAGIRVILTPSDVPRWASDSTLWSSPPGGYEKGYASFYAMDTRASSPALASFSQLGAFLAGHFGPEPYGVRHFECWNEPNLGLWIYPQRRAGSSSFGLNVYRKMLVAYAAGVHGAQSSGVVIAGATAPRGTNNDYSTTPQTFARYIREKVSLNGVYDAYSHHPYTPKSTRKPAPNQPPNNPDRAVNLQNLGQLLKIIPNKPFYLTEYGYGTHYSTIFGFKVSQADQARYLKQAYAYVARYPRVKVLVWYLMKDWGDYATNFGAFTGLSDVSGVYKPSWYAFAGRNTLTLETPSRTRASTAFVIAGSLGSGAYGSLQGKTLILEARKPGATRWSVVKRPSTGPDGRFEVSVKQSGTRIYRVLWDGVVTSTTRKVRTP